jgi:hypothetical protein
VAINLSFIDFIVPISAIRERYPGGFEKCLYDHRRSLGGVVYFDRYLFHTGAMSDDGIQRLIEKWSALGFEATEVVDGETRCKDFCVVQSLLSHITYPCHWLMYDEDERFAYLAGTKPGAIVGRRLFYERRRTKKAQSEFKKDCRRMRWAIFLIYWSRYRNAALAARLNSWLVRKQEWEPL